MFVLSPGFSMLLLESCVTLHQIAEEESLLVNLSVFIPSLDCLCSVSLTRSAMSLFQSVIVAFLGTSHLYFGLNQCNGT